MHCEPHTLLLLSLLVALPAPPTPPPRRPSVSCDPRPISNADAPPPPPPPPLHLEVNDAGRHGTPQHAAVVHAQLERGGCGVGWGRGRGGRRMGGGRAVSKPVPYMPGPHMWRYTHGVCSVGPTNAPRFTHARPATCMRRVPDEAVRVRARVALCRERPVLCALVHGRVHEQALRQAAQHGLHARAGQRGTGQGRRARGGQVGEGGGAVCICPFTSNPIQAAG